jgi:hypothetical protein
MPGRWEEERSGEDGGRPRRQGLLAASLGATARALEEDCRLADIVIAPFTIGTRCRAARVIVDRRMLKVEGAHALYIEGL